MVDGTRIHFLIYRAQDTILEEDEVALNLYNALRVGGGYGRNQRRLLRIDFKTVVVVSPL